MQCNLGMFTRGDLSWFYTRTLERYCSKFSKICPFSELLRRDRWIARTNQKTKKQWVTILQLQKFLFNCVASNCKRELQIHLYWCVGASGKESDITIFENSPFNMKLQNNQLNIPGSQPLPGTENPKMPFTFIGDEAFFFHPK